MQNKLKLKDIHDGICEIPFDPNYPITIEVISIDTETTVTVKDPTGVSSTQEWVGGAKKR